MTDPFFTRPDAAYKDSFITAVHEFHAEGRRPEWNIDVLMAEFDEFVATLRARETEPMAGMVPETIFWLILEDQFVGRLGLRHRLNEDLILFGGNIGYEIRPTMRQRGYGKLMCRMGLDEARKLGLPRVLITCDDDNLASIRIIESNGGVLENKVDNQRATLTRRYWVDLSVKK